MITLTADGIAVKTAKHGDEQYLRSRQWYISREHYIYSRMGPHPRLPRVLSWDPETCALGLDYLVNMDLQWYMHYHRSIITAAHRVQWITNLLMGLCHVHACGIIHCDLTLPNLLLDADLRLKIADFESSSIGGAPYEGSAGGRLSPPRTYDEHGNSIYGMKEEIFTLGCTMYTILGGQIPFPEIIDDRDEINARWTRGQYPDTSKLLWGDMIHKCWTGEIKSVPELMYLKHQSLVDFTKERFAHQRLALLGESDLVGRPKS
jgi:serine/threonine protein kinase